jgi:acyl-CoA thioesterase FadM
MVDQQGRRVLEAKTVQVMYDYGEARPVPIPPEIRAALEREMETPSSGA